MQITCVIIQSQVEVRGGTPSWPGSTAGSCSSTWGDGAGAPPLGTRRRRDGGGVDFSESYSDVKRLLDIDFEAPDAKPFNPVFLVGNHDNYLLTTGRNTTYEFRTLGLHSEHGHAVDVFNRNSDSSKGWALTQVAYLYPNVRYIEHPISMVAKRRPGQVPNRIDSLHHAVKKAVVEQVLSYGAPAIVYAQGHTHIPFLREVILIDKGPVKAPAGGGGSSGGGGGASVEPPVPPISEPGAELPIPDGLLPDGLSLPDASGLEDLLEPVWPPPGWGSDGNDVE